MAVTPFKPVTPPPAQGADDSQDPDLKVMLQKLQRAEIDRNRHKSRISDCYKYAMPWRHQFDQNQPTDQLDEIFDSTPQRVLEDFAADMLHPFTPIKNNWLKEEAPPALDPATKRQLAPMIAQRQQIVFAEMARSNLYQALQESYFDLGIGTMSLLINDIDPTKPIHCEALPATDKLITRGPFGFIDGEFRKRKYLLDEIKVLWPDADVSKLTNGAAQPKDNPEYEITDGCWRDWTDRGDETYKYLVVYANKILYRRVWKGAGACPFITARWLRDSTTAWGFGPQYSTLPDIKTLNHFAYLSLKNYDKHVDPPTSYEDDGVVNIDNGVQPGDWIPRATGSEPPEPIESKSKFDYEAFKIDERTSAIKRAHYQDRPEQLGKTPPTATQWADEAAERARRMGTPATNLVMELQIPIYRRFVYLLEQRGVLPPIRLDSGEEIALEPISPLLRAQEQEEVVRMDRFAELIVARFGPQMGMVAIDVIPYVKRMAEKLGIDPDMVRDETKMAAAIEQLAPVLQATGYLPSAAPDVAVPAGLPA